MPPPAGDPDAPLRALIFDSKFDQYRGVVALVRVVDGAVRAGDSIRFLSTGKTHEVTEVGRAAAQARAARVDCTPGKVGLHRRRREDRRRRARRRHGRAPVASRDSKPLAGFREVKSMVFSGLYPIDAEQYEAAQGGARASWC